MRISVARRNAALDTFIAAANSGLLRIYDDTAARPTNADTAVPGGSVLLAELTMNATSFPGASSGTLTANAITDESSAPAAGDALWARLFQSDGTTPICDFGVTTSSPSDGNELQLPSLTIALGQVVSASSLVINFPVGA